MKTRTRILAVTAALFVLPSLSGCGPGVAGEYTCRTPMVDVQLTLQPGGKLVSAGRMFGETVEKPGTYEVDGDKLTAVVDGNAQIFTIDGDKLDSGPVHCTRQ